MPPILDALHEFQRSQDAPRSIVLMRVAWQAKSADAHKALFIAAELHEGAVPPVHHVLHALHDELHSSHLLGMRNAHTLVQQGGEAQEDARERADLIDEVQVPSLNAGAHTAQHVHTQQPRCALLHPRREVAELVHDGRRAVPLVSIFPWASFPVLGSPSGCVQALQGALALELALASRARVWWVPLGSRGIGGLEGGGAGGAGGDGEGQRGRKDLEDVVRQHLKLPVMLH
mmetsp:Transcript_4236/g.11435  ORF Transcript_4236/g.11435 Transcript_4236/m.11435 type:complete len:231 (-) Transcript_4236:2380-3072(-)